jgi:urea transporter
MKHGSHSIAAATRAVVCMDTEVDAGLLPFNVMVTGAKLHVAPAGRPVQLKLTLWVEPFMGVTLRLVLAVAPAATVSEVGTAAIVKSAGAPDPLTTWLATLDMVQQLGLADQEGARQLLLIPKKAGYLLETVPPTGFTRIQIARKAVSAARRRIRRA